MIGLTILALLTSTAIPIFIGTLQSSSGLGAKQGAVTIASQRLEYVRSIAPADLLKGRNATDVAALIAAPGLVDLSADVTGSGNSDPAAAAGSAAALVPLTVTQALAGTTFTVRTFVDSCYLSRADGSCLRPTSNGGQAYRVTVDVAWPRRPGVQCSSAATGTCEYVVATLIDPSSDPVFSLSGTPTITAVKNGGTTPPSTLGPIHPGQQYTLQIQGYDFAAGASVIPGSGDTTGAVTGNTGTAITVDYLAGTTTGSRTLTVNNPSGAVGTTNLAVSTSAPTIAAVSPASASRLVATTFTVTGTDFFATPTLATQTTKPTLSISATRGGLPVTLVLSNVTLVSGTSMTFRTTLPFSFFSYTLNCTLTQTNPDGGTVDYAFTLGAT